MITNQKEAQKAKNENFTCNTIIEIVLRDCKKELLQFNAKEHFANYIKKYIKQNYQLVHNNLYKNKSIPVGEYLAPGLDNCQNYYVKRAYIEKFELTECDDQDIIGYFMEKWEDDGSNVLLEEDDFLHIIYGAFNDMEKQKEYDAAKSAQA